MRLLAAAERGGDAARRGRRRAPGRSAPVIGVSSASWSGAQGAVGPRLDVLLDVGDVEQTGEEEPEQHGEEHRAGREAAPARPLVPLRQRPDASRRRAAPRVRATPPTPRTSRSRHPARGGCAGRRWGTRARASRRRRARHGPAGSRRRPAVPTGARLALVPAVEGVALRARAVVPARAGRAGRARRAELPHAPVARHLVGRRPRLLAPRRPQVPDEEVVVRARRSNGIPICPGTRPREVRRRSSPSSVIARPLLSELEVQELRRPHRPQHVDQEQGHREHQPLARPSRCG